MIAEAFLRVMPRTQQFSNTILGHVRGNSELFQRCCDVYTVRQYTEVPFTISGVRRWGSQPSLATCLEEAVSKRRVVYFSFRSQRDKGWHCLSFGFYCFQRLFNMYSVVNEWGMPSVTWCADLWRRNWAKLSDVRRSAAEWKMPCSEITMKSEVVKVGCSL